MIILNLEKELYPKWAISKAIIDYEQLSKIILLENTTQWKCLFRKCKKDQNMTIHEFENYIINIMNDRIKV